MNSSSLRILSSLALLLTLSACSSSSDPSTGPKRYLELYNIVPDQEFAALIQIANRRFDYADMSTSIIVNEAQAQFLTLPSGSPTPFAVTAGNVYHNDYKLTEISTIYQRAYENSGNAIFSDGRMHTIRVTGSSDFPALLDSLPAPVELTVISFPTTHDTVNRADGLTVRWNKGQADTVYLRAHVMDNYVTRFVPNSGSYTFTPDELAKFGSGQMEIEITRFNYRKHPVIQGTGSPRYALIYTESAHTVQPMLR